jgi:hypothetical protein
MALVLERVVATKTCYKCRLEQPTSNFSAGKNFHTYCKACDSGIGKARLAKEKNKYKTIPESKFCPTCATDKKSSDFSKCKSRKDGLDIRCKSCASHSSKIQHYKKQYGFTTEQAKEHLQNQHGECKICGVESKLYVDHCHNSGKVRGLICNFCNSILGYAKDSEQTLLNAIEYLKANK